MIQTIEEEKGARQNLEQLLQSLNGITPESLVRTQELGTTLDFSGGVEVFARVLTLFKALHACSLDNVPVNILNDLVARSQDAVNIFKQIQDFSPSQGNPAPQRDSLLNTLATKYHNWFAVISPVIAYAVRKGTDFERIERDARATLADINSIKQDLLGEKATILAEAQQALEKVRQAAADVGVAQHNVHFANEAADHLKRSRRWLSITGWLAAATILLVATFVAYYMFSGVSIEASRAVQLGIAKVLLFSLLYYAIVWSARMYRSQWHNYVVNKHRQNALSTFETFVKAAGDEQTKNAVLLHATQCIFSPQVTGFVSQDSDNAPSPQVLEIFRGVTEKAH